MLSRRSPAIYFEGIFVLIFVLQKLINSWFYLVSQIPSHPIRINSSLIDRVLFLTSGNAIISYSSGPRSTFFLYSKSPIARERFKFPFTRPSVMNPPAFFILALSFFISGLWSIDNSVTFPFSEMTLLESPALAI